MRVREVVLDMFNELVELFVADVLEVIVEIPERIVTLLTPMDEPLVIVVVGLLMAVVSDAKRLT